MDGPSVGLSYVQPKSRKNGGTYPIIPNLYKFAHQSTLAQPISSPYQITDTYGWIYPFFGPPLLQPKTQSRLRPHKPIGTNLDQTHMALGLPNSCPVPSFSMPEAWIPVEHCGSHASPWHNRVQSVLPPVRVL